MGFPNFPSPLCDSQLSAGLKSEKQNQGRFIGEEVLYFPYFLLIPVQD